MKIRFLVGPIARMSAERPAKRQPSRAALRTYPAYHSLVRVDAAPKRLKRGLPKK